MLPKNCTQNSAKFAVKYTLTSANLLKKDFVTAVFL